MLVSKSLTKKMMKRVAYRLIVGSGLFMYACMWVKNLTIIWLKQLIVLIIKWDDVLIDSPVQGVGVWGEITVPEHGTFDVEGFEIGTQSGVTVLWEFVLQMIEQGFGDALSSELRRDEKPCDVHHRLARGDDIVP